MRGKYKVKPGSIADVAVTISGIATGFFMLMTSYFIL